MKAAPKQNMIREKITTLRRTIEALAPYATHRVGCEATRGDRRPCTCGLTERLATAHRLCQPNTVPADYTPRKYG